MTRRGGVDTAAQVNLLKDRSRTILSATTQRETASEGVFTTELLRILGEYSRNVEVASVTDVFDEVRNPVIRKSDRRMTPQMAHTGEGDGEFLFFPLAIAGEEVAAIQSEVTAVRETNSSELASADLSQGLLSGVIERANKRSGRRTTIREVSATLSATKYWYGENAAEQTNYWRAMRERFHKNAAWGDALAMAGLHFCYSAGLGEAEEKPDHDAAYQWAVAAEQVDPTSGVGKCLLGRCYRLGIGIGKNGPAGLELSRQSSKAGFVLGQIFHAQHTLRNSPTPEQVQESISVFQKGMDAGIAFAAVVLGELYASGKFGLPQDLMKTVALYEKALDMGYVATTMPLSNAYRAGKPGFPQRDLERSEQYLRQGAAAGAADCQFYLGAELLQCPSLGWDMELEKNPSEGLRLLELAAEQKYPQALVALGELYGDGNDPNVGTNFDKAREYTEKAARLRYSSALILQGRWYSGDYGVYPRDEAKALQCFEEAGALNDPLGCSQAGRYYELGIGVDVPVKYLRVNGALHPKTHAALHWYEKALQCGGDEWAQKRLERFRDLLNSEKRGMIQAPGFEPSLVLGIWKMRFPDTAASFEQRYWDAPPFPGIVEAIQKESVEYLTE